MARTKVIVGQDEKEPVEKTVLATSIVRISTAVEALRASGLNERAIIVLVADKTKISKGVIETVLDGLGDLRRTYTR